MTKKHVPFLTFLLLFLSTLIPTSFDFAVSVVPGWHTAILPSGFLWKIFVSLVLLLIAIAYWRVSKKANKINWTVVAVHFALTIPILIIKFPNFFQDTQKLNQEEMMKAMEVRMVIIQLSRLLFVIAQIIFLLYFINTMKGYLKGMKLYEAKQAKV